MASLFHKVTVSGHKGPHNLEAYTDRTVQIQIVQGRWLTTLSNQEFKKQFAALAEEQETEIQHVYTNGSPGVWYAVIKSAKLYNRLVAAELTYKSKIGTNDTQRIFKVQVSHLDKMGHIRGVLRGIPFYYTVKMVEEALTPLCEEGQRPKIFPIEKENGTAYNVIFKPNIEEDSLPHFLELQCEGYESVVAILQLKDRRMLCPTCLTDRHYPGLCRQIYYRFMDGVFKKDGKYEAIPEWGEEERRKQKSRLNENRSLLDKWDEEGPRYRSTGEGRGQKRTAHGRPPGLTQPTVQHQPGEGPTFIFDHQLSPSPPTKRHIGGNEQPTYADKLKEFRTPNHPPRHHNSPAKSEGSETGEETLTIDTNSDGEESSEDPAQDDPTEKEKDKGKTTAIPLQSSTPRNVMSVIHGRQDTGHKNPN
jgi:hypothetical protein